MSKLQAAFATALGIPAESVVDTLQYNSIKEWDSVGHMALVAELESRFEVMLDTDEILKMNSVAQARAILKNHGVECDA